MDRLVDRLFAQAMRGNVRAATLLFEYAFGRPRSTDELRVYAQSIDIGNTEDAARKWLSEVETKERLGTTPLGLIEPNEKEDAPGTDE
jgi:hypothetical protein